MRHTVAAVERVLGWSRARRRRTVRRLDGGIDTDANLTWAFWHGYQVLAKGYRGKREQAFAQVVPWWEELCTGERWLAPAPSLARRRPLGPVDRRLRTHHRLIATASGHSITRPDAAGRRAP